jgi:hypothetical protein
LNEVKKIEKRPFIREIKTMKDIKLGIKKKPYRLLKQRFFKNHICYLIITFKKLDQLTIEKR